MSGGVRSGSPAPFNPVEQIDGTVFSPDAEHFTCAMQKYGLFVAGLLHEMVTVPSPFVTSEPHSSVLEHASPAFLHRHMPLVASQTWASGQFESERH